MTNTAIQTLPLQTGMDVFGAEGDKVGSIHEVRDDYIVVEKGFFFPKDYYIPWSAIEGVTDDNEVYLLVTKDQALDQRWDTAPVPEVTSATNSAEIGTGAGTAEVIAPEYTAQTDATAPGSDATRVPIYEEQVTPVKRPVSRGAVRIEKKLVTENRTISVPVTEERVRVTRVDTDEPVSADATDLLQEGTIEVPLQGEEVSLEKTARKTGEVIVEKEADLREEQVGSTIRREEVVVDDETLENRNRTRRTA
jgi:uncharacterized protein (TIGR02271 family)